MSPAHAPERFDAVYLDAQGAPRRVSLRLTPEVMFVDFLDAPGRAPLVWAWWEVRETQGHRPGEPPRLQRLGAPGESLVVEAVGFPEAFARQQGAARIVDPGRGARRALLRKGLWTLGVLAVVAGVVIGVVPALAEVLARQLPVHREEQLGELLLEGVAPPAKRCRDPELARTLDRLAQRLAGAGPELPYHLRVVVSDQPELNAFALPGGRIVVLRGLLEKTQRPEELAGVLAHELQHVLHRDVTTALFRRLSLSVLGALVLGNARLAGAAEALTNLHYDRGQEAEADRDGLELVLAAGLDSGGMIDAFKKLQASGPAVPKALSLLSDHPDLAARLEALEARAGPPSPSRPPFPLDEPWATTAARCGAVKTEE